MGEDPPGEAARGAVSRSVPKGRPEGRPHPTGDLSRGSGVDGILSQVGEDLVRILLLNERLLEQTLRFREAQLLGPGEQGAVAGDLVMLHGLSRRNQTSIESLPALERLQDLLALLDDALNGLAFNTLGLRAHDLEHLLQALHLALGFSQVNGECAPKLIRLGRLCHLWQGFEDGILGEVGVLRLVDEKGLEVFLSHGVVSWILSAGPTQHSKTRARSVLFAAVRGGEQPPWKSLPSASFPLFLDR